ncbi:MAG: polyprenyl synthetase family protein [Neisseriaceae bacterium]
MKTEGFTQWMAVQKEKIEEAIVSYLPKEDAQPQPLSQAMHYSVLGQGKRIRPLLVIAASQLGVPDEIALSQHLTAVEFIHTYSLLHDDLPAMDNDDLRRNKPTCHKVFGEAMALLAGDTLQSLAFEILTLPNTLAAEQKLKAFQILAHSIGFEGMAGGQAFDLLYTAQPIQLNELKLLHQKKTGALIEASILLGLLSCKNYNPQLVKKLKVFAKKIGLAFQIVDDILDEQAPTHVLGKTAGKDARNQKATFPLLLGIDKAYQCAQELIADGIELLQPYEPESLRLTSLASYVLERHF